MSSSPGTSSRCRCGPQTAQDKVQQHTYTNTITQSHNNITTYLTLQHTASNTTTRPDLPRFGSLMPVRAQARGSTPAQLHALVSTCIRCTSADRMQTHVVARRHPHSHTGIRAQRLFPPIKHRHLHNKDALQTCIHTCLQCYRCIDEFVFRQPPPRDVCPLPARNVSFLLSSR